MSLYRINPDDLEFFTIVANPKRTYSSSSISAIGITGSVNVFAGGSDSEKDIKANSQFLNLFFDDVNVESILKMAKKNAITSGNNSNSMAQYLSFVRGVKSGARRSKVKVIKRFEPPVVFSDDNLKKSMICSTLLRENNHIYPNNHFAYTNYHTLNFFTASSLPTASVILYPNVPNTSSNTGFVSGCYSLSSAFTFDFWINPRYTNDSPTVDFRAGTIFNLTASYTISLISGSSKDSKGFVDKFRIQLQLSHSADIAPSSAVAGGGYPNDLVFRTPDNSLKRNNWHHVAIRWGTNTVNQGSGSFFIDGVEVSTFLIPSATVNPRILSSALSTPAVLCIGNYYEGSNALVATQQGFFNQNVAVRDGLYQWTPFNLLEGFPVSHSFTHPLNAEVHDLKIFNTFRSDQQILTSTYQGVDSLESLIFYVPPFFTKESPFRRVSGSFQGGVLITPFTGTNGTTTTPFNVSMSFGIGGHYINLENFGRDFAQGLYPRWLHLSGSQAVVPAIVSGTVNDFMYQTGSVRKRNLTILPCDNGLFFPNFNILRSGTLETKPSLNSNHSLFVDDLGVLNLGYINLNNLVSTSSYSKELTEDSGTLYNNIVGVRPENFTGTPGWALGVLQRTRDTSSNEVVIFDVSNIFYGNRISPKTLKLQDSSLTGSGDKVQITLKDDGLGNLYRADALTKHATWSSVGNVCYNEGIILIKSPHIPKFGKDQFYIEFDGEQTIHVLKVVAEAKSGLVNSSSNPNYMSVSASLLANDQESDFVYITNLYYLDENLNVLMKSNLAQPIKKKSQEKVLIKSSIDF